MRTMLVAVSVSRPRCGILHAAPREAGTVTDTGAWYGPGSAAHHAVKNSALRCVRGTASGITPRGRKHARLTAAGRRRPLRRPRRAMAVADARRDTARPSGSDLGAVRRARTNLALRRISRPRRRACRRPSCTRHTAWRLRPDPSDRKSTRLNSSHGYI